MTQFSEVMIVNEMNDILNRYGNREISNNQALKQLMEKFTELQKMGTMDGEIP